MHFRAKFQAISLIHVPLPCLNFIFWLYEKHTNSPHHFECGLTTILMAITALLWFLKTNFTYWELDSTSLRQCWLWTRTEIGLRDVTRVGLMDYKHPAASGLEIDYVHPGPMIERKSLHAAPKDREEFLATLRGFAPQATFDV